MATIQAIRRELDTKSYQVLHELAELKLRRRHSPPLRYNPLNQGTEQQKRKHAINTLIEWAGDPQIKDELAVLIGLPPDADEMAENAVNATNAATASARWAKWSLVVSILALILALFAVAKDWFGGAP